MYQKCEHVRTDYLFVVFGPKWSLTPNPIPSVNVKVPFREKNIETTRFKLLFMICMKSLEKS